MIRQSESSARQNPLRFAKAIFIFCRGAGIRTQTKRSQSVRATVTQRPDILCNIIVKVPSCQRVKSVITFKLILSTALVVQWTEQISSKDLM